jgi:outer membrane biosynthesis protein TonB
MGWGGEFTATSMIGWIALAGIIVRNSILLVDFSIHQIQQGASVVESVIMACKTRTRPIMITALALVCGSSVIFFDPIFQGMAISLASGVLVSTVLTLVVIPLGCISASKDLLEVAVANAPEGAFLPQPESAAVDTATPASGSRREQVQDKRRPSLPAKIWRSMVSLVTMVFYLFRGLFLLLFQLMNRFAKSASSGKSEDIPPAGGGTGGEGPSGQTPTAVQGGGQSEAPSSMAAQSATVATTAPAVTEEAAASVSDVGTEAETEKKAGEGEVKPEEQVKQTDEAQESAKPAARQQAAKKKVVVKAKKRPSTLKKQAKKKTATAKAKKATAQTTTAKKSATSGNGGEQGDGRPNEVVERRKVASGVAPFPVRKRSPRRGIRLK